MRRVLLVVPLWAFSVTLSVSFAAGVGAVSAPAGTQSMAPPTQKAAELRCAVPHVDSAPAFVAVAAGFAEPAFDAAEIACSAPASVRQAARVAWWARPPPSLVF